MHCSSSDGAPAPSTGGAPGSGGLPASGGALPSPSGGQTGTGSVSNTGGTSTGGATGGASSGGASTGGTASGGSSSGGGTGGDGGTASGGAGTGGGTSTGPFPPVTDFTKDGPFTSTVVNATGPNGNYAVYVPTPLAPNGAKNPIVGWMSGGGTTQSGYPLLPRLATHGFLVVASNTVPGIGAEVALGQEIIAGIDWAIAENGKAGSQFEGKLDTTKLASMGYSMGSLATFTIANDKRLTTTVHISGGNMVPERVDNLHAPAAFICGTPGDSSCNILSATCDIAGANCATDFAGSKVPTFYAVFPGGHLGVLQAPMQDRIYLAATAWLRWKLMDDTTLAPMFVGPDCTICKEPNWKVQQKNLQ
jgi:hypothetical protein